jgi:phospholipid N-methyltransferase
MIDGLDLAAARTVVEVGPGTGAFTEVILGAAGPATHILAVELNPEFASRLRGRFPRLALENDSVENLGRHLDERGLAPADIVLCGLPWAAFGASKQQRLLRAISGVLRPAGHFATFAYLHGTGLPWGRHFRSLLEGDFSEVHTSPVVWRNVPPAIVYRCRK